MTLLPRTSVETTRQRPGKGFQFPLLIKDCFLQSSSEVLNIPNAVALETVLHVVVTPNHKIIFIDIS